MGVCDLCKKIVFEYGTFRVSFSGVWKDVDICKECGRKIVRENKGGNEDWKK